MTERTQFNYAERWNLRFYLNKRLRKQRIRFTLSAVAISLFVLLALALPWIWQYKVEYELAKVESAISPHSSVAAALTETERLQAEINKMEAFLKTIEQRAKNPQEIMGQLHKLLPAGAKVTSFALQADYALQISVIVPGPVDTAKLWISFRDSGWFTEFDLNSVPLTDQEHNLNLNLKLKQ